MDIASRPQAQQRRAAVTVRPFGPQDYPAIAAVANAVFPDRPSTAEEWRYDDEHFDTRFANERYVAADPERGEILGFAGFWHMPVAFHPRKFGMEVRVRPEVQRRGIGTVLWGRVEAALRARQALSVKTQVWERMPEGLAFAERAGFREVMRAWESRLDVQTFAVASFQQTLERTLAGGVAITTLAAEREKDPLALRRLHALDAEIAADVPRPPDDRPTLVPFEMWMEHMVEAPWAIPDAYFIAVVDGAYAGVSRLLRPEIGDWFNQGLTGVRREMRGRGLATALKVRTVEYARTHGVREIRTWNEIDNQRMLAINEKFGFVRQPAWLTFQKDFGE